jgi:hypothetical protein
MVWRKRITAFLILILLTATVVEVSHSHVDTADHHDCPICVASHHQPATGTSSVALEVTPWFTQTSFVAEYQFFAENPFSFSRTTRGPPA